MANFDCGLNMQTCMDIGVQGMPTTLALFPGQDWTADLSTVEQYQVPVGDLTRQDFMEWYSPLLAAHQAEYDAVVEIRSMLEFRQRTDDRPHAVMFTQPDCIICDAIQHVWEDIAAENTADVVIASFDCAMADQQLCPFLGLDKWPSIMYFEPGVEVWRGPKYDILADDFTEERFSTWLDSVHAQER